MAEQFLKGYAVDVATLASVVGGDDADSLIKRAKRKKSLFEEITELLEEWGESLTIEKVLGEIASGTLNAKHAYEYRRVLQMLAEMIGTPLKPEDVTLPGRGWQDLSPAWKHWGLTHFAKAYSSTIDWPAKRKTKGVDWPIAIVIARKDVAVIEKEMRAFDPSSIPTRGVPKGVPRFSDDWDLEELAEEIEELVSGVTKWLAKTRVLSLDLLLWIDGQQ